eukprot:Gregarina_sp_Poly_1__6141@NODE_3243_length_1244_cov_224_669499_g1809_i3_p1_GENE_NODE_3243_length_1244_cov_224_669499_g1809_i3NODE_3243_length_1244_cov_224_669499_g1809_i3_p1_ORF_typecomplete_len124_score3_00PTPS/PF01242_19/6_7e10_NODE_3243_length_1244_cov_224_669499_g1809_i3493864
MRAGTAASPVSSTGVSNVRKICVGGDELHFECAHFIVQKSGSFPDSSPRKIIREPLHGHSYHVEVTLWGELLDDGFIIDFRLVRKEAIRLCRVSSSSGFSKSEIRNGLIISFCLCYLHVCVFN